MSDITIGDFEILVRNTFGIGVQVARDLIPITGWQGDLIDNKKWLTAKQV